MDDLNRMCFTLLEHALSGNITETFDSLTLKK